jgi:alpha-tubulin suppressor-like RCC1 family protein
LLTNRNRVFVTGLNSCGELGLSHYDDNVHSFKESHILGLKDGEWVSGIKGGHCYIVLFTNHNRMLVSGRGWPHNRLNTFQFHPIKCLQEGEWVRDVKEQRMRRLILITNFNRLLRTEFTPQKSWSEDIYEEYSIDCLEKEEWVNEVQTGDHHIIVLTNRHRVLVAGSNRDGQLGLPPSGKDLHTFQECNIECLNAGEWVFSVRAGADHTVLLTNQNRVLVSGRNGFGQLGLAHNQNMDTFAPHQALVRDSESKEDTTLHQETSKFPCVIA